MPNAEQETRTGAAGSGESTRGTTILWARGLVVAKNSTTESFQKPNAAFDQWQK